MIRLSRGLDLGDLTAFLAEPASGMRAVMSQAESMALLLGPLDGGKEEWHVMVVTVLYHKNHKPVVEISSKPPKDVVCVEGAKE